MARRQAPALHRRVLKGALSIVSLLVWSTLGPKLIAQATTSNDAAMAADPNAAALERGKRVFRLNECNYCHGIDLTRAPRGARADLKHNPLVGADEKGELIGLIVMNGLPMSQTSMPRFGDVITTEQMVDLAAYIHFQRQAERYKELIALKEAPGNSAAGKAYFNEVGKCATCHAPTAITTAVKKLDTPALKLNTLHPNASSAPTAQFDSGYRAHLKIVERITDDEFLNLLAYLNSLR
jgi:mono/diheme cytochrome c family protein